MINCFDCKLWHDEDLVVHYPDEGLYRCHTCAYKHEKKVNAALTTRLQEAEAMLQEASKKLNEKYAYVALEWATPDVAQAHADVLTHKYDEFLKGGTE